MTAPRDNSNWSYGDDNGELQRYVSIDPWPSNLTHEEWILRLAQSRGNATQEDTAWTVDWKYADTEWRLGVGGWPLEKALQYFLKVRNPSYDSGYEHRVRNMITGEIIPPELFCD